MVENSEDRFSRDEAHLLIFKMENSTGDAQKKAIRIQIVNRNLQMELKRKEYKQWHRRYKITN